MILEQCGRDRKLIESELKDGKFIRKYWDARLFGNTFLEEGASTSIKPWRSSIRNGRFSLSDFD